MNSNVRTAVSILDDDRPNPRRLLVFPFSVQSSGDLLVVSSCQNFAWGLGRIFSREGRELAPDLVAEFVRQTMQDDGTGGWLYRMLEAESLPFWSCPPMPRWIWTTTRENTDLSVVIRCQLSGPVVKLTDAFVLPSPQPKSLNFLSNLALTYADCSYACGKYEGMTA